MQYSQGYRDRTIEKYMIASVYGDIAHVNIPRDA